MGNRQAVIIVVQVIHLSSGVIAIIKQLVPVGCHSLATTVSQIEPKWIEHTSSKMVHMLLPYRKADRLLTWFKYSLSRFLPSVSANGKCGLDATCTFSAISALIKYSNAS
ncbi:MAG: hypothetical protein DBX91_06090 [Subdoligranulum variabile]|nr:MAG: hypothetical protein DBX91_06090 [Subdoligranulum variabile]